MVAALSGSSGGSDRNCSMTRRAVIVSAVATLAVALLAIAALVGLAPRPAPGADSSPTPDAAALTFAQQAPPPPLAAEPGPGYAGLVDRTWAQAVADATGIPTLAVVGYAAGALGAEDNFPGCGIGWNTLAGIGLVESDHGRHGGGVIDSIGHIEPKIFGVPLDGNGVVAIADTDGGEFDEDATVDRAIGPMQIIPQTWRSWVVDGSGDGVPDPHNINDASLAAADYLCHAAGELRTPDGWRSGIASYNAGQSYLESVAAAAQRYADAAASVAP